ncbi:hypothetical protein Taro_007702, partial [Colocasia esculenta]|nr:hypothetical protein [Colocasia esculenta]
VRASCEAWWAGRWAQSAHRFCACERDNRLRRVLKATTLRVAFTLPLLGGLRLLGCRVSRAGQSALGRQQSPRSRSGRDRGACRDLNRCTIFKNPGRTELLQALLDQGELLRGFSGRFKVLVEFSTRSRREDVVRSGGKRREFVFFVKVEPVHLLRSWSVLLTRELGPESLEVPGMDLQLRVCRCGVGWSPHLFDLFSWSGSWTFLEVFLSEVCPGVGTIVIEISERRLTGCGLLCVECPSLAHVLRFCRGGVPCVWHWCGCDFRSGIVEELCSVKVVWCDLPLVVFSSSSGVHASCEACDGLEGRVHIAATRQSSSVWLPRVARGAVDLGKATVTKVATEGELLRGFSRRFEVLVEFSARSRREDLVLSGGKRREFVFFVKYPMSRPQLRGGASALVTLMERIAHEVGIFYVVNVLCTVCTVEVCVVFLDTLTPVFQLYVRLREKRQ